VIINGKALEYADVREYSINYSYYTIIKQANGDEYIFLPITNREDVVTVKYQPNYNEYTADSDVVNIQSE
jgi:hypothetical protein